MRELREYAEKAVRGVYTMEEIREMAMDNAETVKEIAKHGVLLEGN